MACDLTTGRSEPCKEIQGGVKKALFLDYVENAFTILNGVVTGIAAGVTEVFEYPLRSDQNNNLTQNIVSSRDNGTIVNTETLNMRLKKLDPGTSQEVTIMAKGRPIAVVVDRAGNYHLVGHEEGLDLTNSNIGTGNAREDFNGYDLTFSAKEGSVAPILDAATVTAIEALVSASVINP